MEEIFDSRHGNELKKLNSGLAFTPLDMDDLALIRGYFDIADQTLNRGSPYAPQDLF